MYLKKKTFLNVNLNTHTYTPYICIYVYRFGCRQIRTKRTDIKERSPVCIGCIFYNINDRLVFNFIKLKNCIRAQQIKNLVFLYCLKRGANILLYLCENDVKTMKARAAEKPKRRLLKKQSV